MLSNRFTLFLSLLLLHLVISCGTDDGEQNAAGKYSLYTMNKDLSNTILTTNTVDSGNLTISKNGIDVSTKLFDRSIIVKDKHFYFLRAGKFRKYTLESNGLKGIAQLAMQDQHIENINWLDRDTLLLFTSDNKTNRRLWIYKIAVHDFKINQQQEIKLPSAAADFNILSVGFGTVHQQQLLVGYTFNKVINETDFTTIDTLYVATLDKATLRLKNIQKDIRSTYPGGVNTVQSYSFHDENGNFYFMSCPGIALGNSPSKPTAIFRIDSNSTHINPTYFLNLTAKTHNHAYGMWYLGNNQAIVRSERRDRYTDFSDHHSTYQFEYYVVDLISQTTTKLNLPFDKGTRKESVLVENGKAYITIDDAKDQHQVWVYDITSKNIQVGLTLDQATDFIVRIDRLN
ncbi:MULTISPECIES: DUF4374 domain-containing protein [Sphingobacterium]|uniref:DUF4374 domain-containing protein n=2 Tax=Sphingobacteriaceae TaxID=84566 RepID=UPI001AEB3142|nr:MULTISPECIES: DUF4374 domain-containing protein [Sphingobacterium]MDR6735862.1 hypothetical protein [Sphingobacterium sp. 2149]